MINNIEEIFESIDYIKYLIYKVCEENNITSPIGYDGYIDEIIYELQSVEKYLKIKEGRE